MKYFIVVIIFSLLLSCRGKTSEEVVYVLKPELEPILSSHFVKGTFIVFDEGSNTWYSNDFERAEMGFMPASTFKIFNSLVGIEEKVVDTTGVIFKWDGSPQSLPQWERDMTFREAFKYSCVPCYQSIARSVGHEKMNNYLNESSYGHMDVNEDNIDRFWLVGESRISPVEQIEFLKKLYHDDLECFSLSTMHTVKDIMIYEKSERFTLSAKTGWAIREGNNTGWFVGYVETNDNVYYFVTNVVPVKDPAEFNFGEARVNVTYRSLELLGVI